MVSMPNKFAFKSFCPALIYIAAFFFATVESQAQQCSISPNSVNLLETLRLTCPAEVASAKWNDRTINLFRQPDGESLALLPVSEKDSPGPASLEHLPAEGTAF